MADGAQRRPAVQVAACESQIPRSKAVLWLQGITIGWMLVECGVSLMAAQQAHSVSVLAFGSDSLVELLSALVVLLQLGKRVKIERAAAARVAGILLFVLAGVIGLLAVAAFVRHVPPEPSVLGLAVTALP